MNELKRGYVVQFNENHKWCGCFGFINEVKGERIMVGIPIPQQGTAYIFCESKDIDNIGSTDLLPKEETNE